MFIQVGVPDAAVTVALITGCTTVAVTCVKAAAAVAIAWIDSPRPGAPASAREIEPPDP